MKALRHTIILLLLLLGTALAQLNLPADGLVGHWKFDDAANLGKAEVGGELVPDKNSGELNIKAIAGPAANNGAASIASGSYLRCFHDIEANGFDPTLPDSTPSRVNQFAIIIDFRVYDTSQWHAFYATDNNGDPNASDSDLFINTSGAIGVGSTGYSFYKIKDLTGYYRLVINANLGNFYRYYLDGQLLRDGGTRRLDDRFSLDAPDGSNQVLFFSDDDGEDALIDVAEMALYNRPLTEQEIVELGGYNHFVELDAAVSVWAFDKPDSLWFPKAGAPLELVGDVKPATGPSSGDRAAAVGNGAYLKADVNLLPNGFNAPQNVNRYTLSMDIRQPQRGKFSALLQTNPDNLDDADLFVNPEGRIGSAAIGWSDSTLYVGEWSRVVLVYDAGDTTTNLTLFMDAKPVLKVAELPSDGDLSLASRNGLNKMLFFADDNGEDAPLDVANISLHNRPLLDKDVVALGKYEHLRSTEVTPALHTVQFRVADESQYAKIPYHSDFDFGEKTSFTVELWIRPDIPYDGDPAVISNKDWGSGGNAGWVLSARGDDWKFNIADQSGARCDATIMSPNINDGFWHHIAVVVNRETQQYLVITDNSVTVPQPLSSGGAVLGNIDTGLPICIMQDGTEDYSEGFKMPGAVDEVRIWNAALTPETVKSWAHRLVTGDHPNYANLLTYLQFNEATGNVVNDASGHGHHAELKGGYQWLISYAPIADPEASAAKDLGGIWGGQKSGSAGALSLAADFKFDLAKMAVAAAADPNSGDAKLAAFPNEQYALSGHNGASGVVKTEISGNVVARFARFWYLDASATFNQKTKAVFTLAQPAGAAANYALLTRSATSANFSAVSAAAEVQGDLVIFSNLTLKDKNYYTLGTKDETASPLGNLSSVDEASGMLFSYALHNAYPNPFNPTTTIAYSLAKTSEVKLTVYNMIGQVVARLVEGQKQAAGLYEISWDARAVPSGVYFYRLEAGEFTRTHKMMLLK